MLLTRNQVDVVLKAYCEQIGVTCTDMHDEAFCVKNTKGNWAYIWYNGDENSASDMISSIEELVQLNRLHISEQRHEHF